jgi:subtilisin family serine protease
VTLVSAAGNEAIDYTKPSVDETSPDYARFPGEVLARTRTIDPRDCLSMPSQGAGVIAVSAVGPSTRKSYYSSFGKGYVDVSAPGGDFYDTPDLHYDPTSATLSAYSAEALREEGVLNPDGTVKPGNDDVVRYCQAGVCAYYRWLQGTSMASPRAVGVAALIVGHYGRPDRRHGGLTLDPSLVRARLRATAVDHACPTPRTVVYVRFRPGDTQPTISAPQTCLGGKRYNGFYGDGIVNALHAVGG